MEAGAQNPPYAPEARVVSTAELPRVPLRELLWAALGVVAGVAIAVWRAPPAPPPPPKTATELMVTGVVLDPIAVHVTATPADATVSLDGTQICGETPCDASFAPAEPGEATLRIGVTRPGHESRVLSRRARPGGRLEVHVRLLPIRPRATPDRPRRPPRGELPLIPPCNFPGDPSY